MMAADAAKAGVLMQAAARAPCAAHHTLVCSKDRRSFERRWNQYRKEIAAMRTLVGLAPTSDAATALSARMRAAQDLAPQSPRPPSRRSEAGRSRIRRTYKFGETQ